MEVKNIQIKILLILLSLVLISIHIVSAQNYDFKIWASGPQLFTIGREEMVNVYILNNGTETDSYTIDFTKQAMYGLDDVSHLLDVSMPSDKINLVKPNKTGNTFATITLMGPITSGSITFNASSDSDPSVKREAIPINVLSGTPISLPEFGLMGLILLILISSLIISYSFHIR